MNTIEHAKMSQDVRFYFQDLNAPSTPLNIQISEVSRLVNLDFAMERLNEAEGRWNMALSHSYASDVSRDSELDSCKLSHEFWANVVRIKAPKGLDHVL